MLSSEFQLMVACCRSNFDFAGLENVQRQAEYVSWEAFLRLVRRHRVQSIVDRALALAEVRQNKQLAELAEDRCTIVQRNLEAAAECIRLSDELTANGIRHIFVKGLTLSALAYGDAFLKASNDIDVLVVEDDIESVAAVLSSQNYGLLLPDLPSRLNDWHRKRKESVWRSTNGSVLDLHSRLSECPRLIPSLGVGSALQHVSIGNARQFPTLSTPDLLTYLAVHGASSAWFRLKWIADFAALLFRSGVTPDQFYRDNLKGEGGHAPSQALLLGHELGLIDLSDGVLAEVRRDRVAQVLAKIALAQLTDIREPTGRRLGTAMIHLSQPLLLTGFMPKVAESVRHLQALAAGRRRCAQRSTS